MKFGLGLVLGLIVASGVASAEAAAPAAPMPIVGSMEFQNGQEGLSLYLGSFGVAIGQDPTGHRNDGSLRYLREIPVANGFVARLGAEVGMDTHADSLRAKDYYAGWTQGVGFEVEKVGFFTDIVVRQTWNVANADFAQGLTIAPRVGISYKIQ